MRNYDKIVICGVGAVLTASVLILAAYTVNASIIDDLREKITGQRGEIEEIEKEIAKYQLEIDKTHREANTLKNEVGRLDANSNKLSSEIKLTERQIETSSLNIKTLSLEIQAGEENIAKKRLFLAGIIRSINESDETTLVELLLSNDNFSDFFGDLHRLSNFQEDVNVSLAQLRELKEDLSREKGREETEKENSEKLKSELADRRSLVEINKNRKNELLEETKNKESNYKNILLEKQRLKEAFEKELRAYESQLRVEIDPASIPPSGSGVLGWPLDDIYITQKFGKTVAAKRLYVSGSHNGVDFRASIGTRVLSAGDGVVLGAGDTDQTCPGASFGKWILIDHENGLAATYAHLSLIKVSEGQQVQRGDIIGYSGSSGYSTGPHLHVSVYARQGVSVKTLPSKVCNGKIYTMPLAPIDAYLDPLDYF